MHQKRLLRQIVPACVLLAAIVWLVASIGQSWPWMIGGAMLAGFAGWTLGRLIERSAIRSVDELNASAERFARGELTPKLDTPDTVELGEIVEKFNRLADVIELRMKSMVAQGNEQRAVMASMSEGVIAIDLQQRVISLNRAAAELLNFAQAIAAGRPLQEVIRNADLRRFVTQALSSDDPISGDIKMLGDHERVWQAHGTALRDAQGQTLGAVIVVNDVTDYRRLENVRRDFVANVSHELKTPIASIKGFVETLLDGALDNRDDAERFCRIIARQSERLHSIIDDLLSLSRIEQSEGAADIALESTLLCDVLCSAINDCQSRADDRAIKIAIVCPEEQRIKCNAPLMIQAVLNLLDNAIKYSDEGGRIDVAATANERTVVISVRDQGCGIPPEHLSRVFERFYRVDRARSRKLGGTGLGLSIVKHIVNVHHGKVTVESTPGKGSTFSIHLPVDAPFPGLLIKA
jgi:two-component system phosphate regulon sensor histidine kinase PhoR